MPVLAIAGSGRGAGKTAVGCALIQALPEFRWTAIKVSPHAHEFSFGTTQESDSKSDKDTGRFLAAGSRSAFLLTVDELWDGKRIPELDGLVRDGLELDDLDPAAILVESNRFALSDWSQSGVRIAVIGSPEPQWKPSTRACALDADALVLTNGMESYDLPLELRVRHRFILRSGKWVSLALLGFVRDRLGRNG